MAVNLGGAYGKIEIDTSGVVRSTQAAVAAMSTVSQASKGMSGGLAAVSKDAQAFGSTFQGVGLALAGVSAGIGLALGKAVESQFAFHDSLIKTSALAGESESAMEGIGEKVLDMSRQFYTGQNTAKDLAEGLFFVTSAGFKGADSMKVLEASARAAASGLGSTMVVADAVTSTLNAYKLGAESASHVTDILTNAVVQGKAKADSFAPAFGRVLPIAAAAGVSFEQVAASMATMTRVGISAEESATALRGVLSAFEKPGKQATEALASLGYSTDDLRKSIRDKGLLLTLQDLMDKTGGNIDALGVIIPNIRALTGVLATAGSQGETYSKILDSMNNATGATARAFEITSKDAGYQLDLLKNNIAAFGITVGKDLEPVVLSLSNSANKVINSLNGMTTAQRGFIEGGAVMVAALTGAAGGFILLAPKIVQAVGTMGQFITFGKEVTTGLQLMKAGFGAAEVAGTGFAGTMAVALPVLLAVTAALYAAYKAYELHVEVMKRTGAVGGAYATMLNDQVAAGKSAEDIMVEYAATQDRVNKAYEAAPWYLKPFIDKQSLVTSGAKEYVKVLGESNISQSAYEAEMRKAADLMGLEIDAQGRLVKVTQAMGATNTEVVQSNYLLTESQRSHAAAMADAADVAENFVVAEDRVADAALKVKGKLDDDKKAADELRDAQAQLADSALDIAKTFATANEKYTERADLTQQLSELDAKVATQGTAHTEVIKKAKMSEDQLQAAITKRLAVEEDIVKIGKKKGESDRELAARLDGLKASYSTLGTKISEATGATGAHIGVVGGATEAQVKERRAILDKIAAMDLEMQKEMATQAVESLNPAMFEAQVVAEGKLTNAKDIGAEAARRYGEAKRNLMLMTGLVTKESLAEKDSIDILTGALAAGDITPRQYAEALGKVKSAAADGVVSLDELMGKFKTVEVPAGVTNFAHDLNIKGAVGAAKTDAVAAGQDLMAGITQGIVDYHSYMGPAITNAVDIGVNSMRAAYGMQSPSTVMAGYGKDLMDGLAMGASGGSAGAALSAAFTSVVSTSVVAMSLALQTAVLPMMLFNAILDATNLRMAGPGGMVPSLQATTLEVPLVGGALTALSTIIGSIVNPSFDATNTKLVGPGGVIPNLDEILTIATNSMETIGKPLSDTFVAVAHSLQFAAQMGNSLADTMRDIKSMDGMVVKMSVVTSYASVGSAPEGAAPAAPTFAMGGYTGAGGPALLHPREFVLSENMRRGLQPVPVNAISPEAIAKLVGQGGKAGAVITDNRVVTNIFQDAMSTKMWMEKERMDQIASVAGAM